MCPDAGFSVVTGTPASQRGLGLVAAIFVITLMALIAAGISTLVVTSQQSYGYEVQSVRAFLAAESGAQLAANALFPPPASSGTCASVPASFAWSSSPGSGLNGCRVNLQCSSRGPVAGVSYFTLVSEGRCGSGIDTAIRQISVRLQDGSP